MGVHPLFANTISSCYVPTFNHEMRLNTVYVIFSVKWNSVLKNNVSSILENSFDSFETERVSESKESLLFGWWKSAWEWVLANFWNCGNNWCHLFDLPKVCNEASYNIRICH